MTLVSKSVFFTKFAFANLAANPLAVKLLNYEFSFLFLIFCVIICFLTKLLTSGILFSTAVNADLVAKLLILGILPSILTL